MARKWLRFPLRSEEQRRIQRSTINVLDGGPSFPDWLRLEFTIDPGEGAPPLMPLFPGTLRFLADPQEPGVIPKATDAFSWTSAQYDTWKTVGTLVVQLNPALVLEIAALPGASEPIPALAWYWPVRLTEAFLFDAIRTHLIKDRIRTGTGRFVETDATSWPQHAVASFLAGSHSVELRLPADPLQDDAVQFLTKMPTVEMTATGEVGLWVALAAGIRIDDRQPLPALPGTTPLLDPRHPGNALLHARKTLTDLALETIGAEQPGSVLAAAALTPWPVGPRYFQVTFTTPGMPRKRYHSGLLPAEEITIRDTGGTVLQQRRLCTNGIVTIAQASAMPMPTPPQLSLTITSNVLRIGETTGSRAGLGSNDIRFDFTTLASPARVSLQPPAPNPPTAAAKRAYSKKLAGLCIKAARAQTTHEAVAESLAEYENWIRPGAWGPADLVFRGTRSPWKGSPDNPVPLKVADLEVLFDALQNITVAGAAPPIIRPGEALVLWLMEGRLTLLDAGLLSPGVTTPWKALMASFPAPRDHPFSAADLTGADVADVTKLVRTLLLWNFFGLDELTKTVWDAVAQDTVPAWSPTPNPTLAASVAVHDAKLAAGLAAISVRSISRPIAAAITNAIETREVGGVWEFRLMSGFIETYVWLQYAEYLRRLVACTDAAQTAPHPAMPVSAREYPAFSYIAFNARADVARAAEFWARANSELAGTALAWVKTPEDALRSWRLEPAEIARTPRGGTRRSNAVRVNGLHFAALVRSFGAVFPRVLYPSG